jgi:hypothetical protein
MAKKKTQTFANHTRLDPLFHFLALPILAFALIGGLIRFLWHPSVHGGLFFILSVAAVITLAKARLYALKVQDRVIRLEERLRLMALCPEPLRSRISDLTVGQLVALRFASDAEVPKLAERALAEKLPPKEIKKAIQTWRPDYCRV